MFVKVIREDGKREACYECADYEMVRDGDERFLLLNRHGGKSITLELDDSTGVYITNNEGRTVESYRWQ